MILDAILGPKRALATYNDERFWTDILSQWGGGPTASGVTVTEDTALNFSAFYRGVSLISGTVATLPLHIYRKRGENNRDRQADHPLDRLLNEEPNPEMDAVTFREVLQSQVITWGNGYSEIVRAGSRPVELWPLHPCRVRPEVQGGEVVYRVREDDGREKTLDKSRVLHIKNLGPDGLCGWSVVRRARESLGLGSAQEQSAGAFFGNGARPGGFLKHPGKLTEKARANLRESFQRLHGGVENQHKFAILEENMDYVNPMMNYRDSQFLESRAFSVLEMSRWLGLPPHLLSDPAATSYASIEAQMLEWLTFGLRYWLVKWERGINRALLSTSEKRDTYTEHMTNALVRADIATRYNAYATGRSGGWLCVNDIRRLENLNPIGPEGDIYLVPANMQPAEALLRMAEEAEDPPEPEPAQPPVPSPNGNGQPTPETPAPTPTDRMGAADAMRRLLADVLGRLCRKEQANALQAAKKPGEFLAWLDGYYLHHQKLMVEALFPVMAVIRSVNLGPPHLDAQEWAEHLAETWTAQSREELLAASGAARPAELPAAVEAVAGKWGQRTNAVCANIEKGDSYANANPAQ